MSTYRQRKEQADRLRSEKPCPDCGHEIGAHRGYPESECIAPDCTCTRSFAA